MQFLLFFILTKKISKDSSFHFVGSIKEITVANYLKNNDNTTNFVLHFENQSNFSNIIIPDDLAIIDGTLFSNKSTNHHFSMKVANCLDILVGPYSGANVYAAITISHIIKKCTIIIVLPDDGIHCLETTLNEN